MTTTIILFCAYDCNFPSSTVHLFPEVPRPFYQSGEVNLPQTVLHQNDVSNPTTLGPYFCSYSVTLTNFEYIEARETIAKVL